MGRGERLFDYGMAEALAFGSLLLKGTPVRLTGQDSQRGTFNQRHSVLVDIENEQQDIPLATWLRIRPASRYITRCCLKQLFSASNTAIAAIIPRRWCYGRRSSVTLPTARRLSSTSSLPPGKTSGDS